jgi:hypothetical protein
VKDLGWPLHAIGDATAPMHVIASPAWGHRPFEDAQEELWPAIRNMSALYADPEPSQITPQLLQARSIYLKAFEWRQFILNWRAAHPGHDKDVPIRDLVTAVAENTYQYSVNKMATDFWPFHPFASMEYLASEGSAVSIYTGRPDAVELVRPLIENGVAAKIAFLVSAAEVLP